MLKLKIALFVLASVVLLGYAGTSDFTEEVIYTMPQAAYDEIVAENPSFSRRQIAQHYLDNKEKYDFFFN